MQDTVATKYIANYCIYESMEYISKSRYGRGWVLAATAHIRRIQPRTTKAQLWKVESERFRDLYYNVIEKSDGDMSCDCPDFENRGETCKHIYSVIIWETT